MEPTEKQTPVPAEDRITIEDLPVMEEMTVQEQKGIFGGTLDEDPYNQQN
jgi:hypothetical protein